MEVGGSAADEMVKETIYFSSEAAKLAGLGIKNLAALLWAMAKDHERSPGRTKIANLMANTKMPRVVHIKPEDRQTFEALAKKSGIVFAPPITYKKVKEDMLHYVFAGESTEQMNLVLEQLGYHKLKEREGKNGEERAAPSERSSSERERTGDTATSTKTRDGQQDAGFHAEPGGAPSGAGGRKSPGQEGSVGAQFAVFMSRSKASAKPGRGAGPDLSR